MRLTRAPQTALPFPATRLLLALSLALSSAAPLDSLHSCDTFFALSFLSRRLQLTYASKFVYNENENNSIDPSDLPNSDS